MTSVVRHSWAVASSATRYPSGLTAVFSPSLDRTSVYDALRSKLCYATTGDRILLDIRVTRRQALLEVNLEVYGTDLLDRAWVFVNGKEVKEVKFPYGTHGTMRWQNDLFVAQDTCYLRISQLNGQLVWINPLPFADCKMP